MVEYAGKKKGRLLMLFTCPICGGKLNIKDSGSAECAKGHSFDRAKQGYYNLLFHGGDHGDNRDMVLARRSFLGKGFYSPLAGRLAEICSERLHEGGVILDSGCGEGYYTSRLAELTAAKAPHIAAFDISRDAVKEAAKKRCISSLAVASSYKIPLEDSACDFILNVFSPLALDETKRVLKQGGYFLMAIPGEEHLFSLKAAIYDSPYKNKMNSTDIDGLQLVSQEELRFPLALTEAEDVRNLFMMTPYAYRTSKEGRDRVLALERVDTEAHFVLLLYKKK